MYVYIETENWTDADKPRHFFTVGHYKPDGKFEAESDHENRTRAAARVHYLNGGVWDKLSTQVHEA